MKQLAPKFLLLSLWVALLILAGIPNGAQRLAAAPIAVVTGTEQPTRTPTPVSATVTPVATDTPGAPSTPTPKPPAGPGLADPSITKAVNVSQARVGDEVTFTITVINNGPNTAYDVVVTDPFPEYLDVIEATTTRGNISSQGRTVIITIGAVGAKEQITIRIRTRVNALAQPPEGRNSVSLTTSSDGDNPDNNRSQVSFQIIGDATATVAPQPSPAAPTPIAPTAAPPRQLPRTGVEDGSMAFALLAACGLLAAGMGLLMRKGARR